jgi:hypothetical protein
VNAAHPFNQIDSQRISPLTGLAFPDLKSPLALGCGLRFGILPWLPGTWKCQAHG